MKKNCMDYGICRKTAGYTQEEAAELLNISVRQLSDYENGKVRVPDDVLVSMTKAYENPFLILWDSQEREKRICELYANSL